jgi:hypothetical protein
MADQQWLAAGVYLAGLISTVLLLGTLSMRAARKRQAISRTRR